MADVKVLSWADVSVRAASAASNIKANVLYFISNRNISIFGIPRGGIFAVQAVLTAFSNLGIPANIVENPSTADVFIDDVLDSGKTKDIWLKQYPTTPFYALVNKPAEKLEAWVSFPWERMCQETGPEENIRRLLEYIGDDPKREGLLETPSRVIRSYDTLFSGYKQDPKDVMKVFTDGACNEMVLLRNIPFSSNCEHHILPFSGKAHIAYIPNGKVLGVSKLVRLLEIYSRRLQIQERIGQQVTDALMTYLKPKGAACILEASHSCMTCRGVQKSGSEMVTSSLKGCFLEEAETRNEFLNMVKG